MARDIMVYNILQLDLQIQKVLDIHEAKQYNSSEQKRLLKSVILLELSIIGFILQLNRRPCGLLPLVEVMFFIVDLILSQSVPKCTRTCSVFYY